MSDLDVGATTSSPDTAGLSGTQAIAATTLATLETDASDAAADAGDTGDTTPPAGDTGVKAEAETPGVVKPAPSEAEQLLQEAGITEPRRPDGRENRIPYSKVVKIIENGLKTGKGQFGQQFAAAQEEVRSYKSRFEGVTPILSKLDEGPDAFLAFAAGRDPRFKAFLEAKTAPQAPTLPTDLPEPDFALPDGSRTYSMKGIREQLVPYIITQARKEAQAAAEAQYKPIAEREQQTRFQTHIEQTASHAANEARTWPHFKEHEAAIVKLLNDNATLSLDAAYRQVVIPAIQADEAKVREKVLADLKTAPTSTAVSRSGAESVAVGKRTTADVAREVYNKLNR